MGMSESPVVLDILAQLLRIRPLGCRSGLRELQGASLCNPYAMRSYNRYIPAIGILAAFLIVLPAAATSATSAIKITNCYKASSRPKSLTLTCADANTSLSALRWSSFGGASAMATGTLDLNTCTPNCAAGKVVHYPVAVAASAPRSCKAGLRVYNKLTLRFTGRPPKSASHLERWTLGCPLPG
jgi:hypothetical protein